MKHTRPHAARNLIGPKVRQVRRLLTPRVSQEDLAGRLAKEGIALDRSAVSRIENQERYVMDYEILAIAKCLKVPVGQLFSGMDR
jgi:transcriptional regulator with XRE-family HTH domain